MSAQEPPRRYPTARAYCFTCYDEHWRWEDEELDDKVRYLVYQRERCPSTNRIHIQGYVELKTPLRVRAVQNLLRLPVDTHMEARSGPREKARAYCMKEATREPGEGNGPWEHGSWLEQTSGNATARCKTEEFMAFVTSPEVWQNLEFTRHDLVMAFPSIMGRMPHLFDYGWDFIATKRVPETNIESLYEWETDLIRMLRPERQMRRIFWIWSERSSTGKSTFVQYLADHPFRGRVLVAPWDLRSLLFMYEDHHIIALNMPRDVHEEFMVDRSYLATLERISDGGWMPSPKYQSRMKHVHAHIIVTANVPPPYERLPYRIFEVALDPGAPIRPEHALAYRGPCPVVMTPPPESESEPEESDDSLTGSSPSYSGDEELSSDTE